MFSNDDRLSSDAVTDDGNSCVQGNFIKQEVAAYPAGAPCLRAQRFALLENRPCERKTGDEKEIHHSPCFSFVVKDHQVGSVAGLNGAEHCAEGGVEDARTEGMGLRFQLVWRITSRTNVIDGGSAGRRWS